MKFKLYKTFGALNSPPIFSAFEEGIRKCGHESVESGEDVAVIWSVLWHGRMKSNYTVYLEAKKNKKPVIIIEVGSLKRGITWKISIDQINRRGYFGHDSDLDINRPEKLGIKLQGFRKTRKDTILIACQHGMSLQWEGMPSVKQWVSETIDKIRQFSNRKIVVRPHPRHHFYLDIPEIKIEMPKKIDQTYDDYDISYDFHCVINHSSGPSVQAAIGGVPVICNYDSLAFPVSEKIENIENLDEIDRREWFLGVCHTEYTVDEIRSGLPIKRLESYIRNYKG